ncbi:hypothetical protein [Rhodococcus yananensis]|uniref:hypothetical protein n=1 Tax=Rhodococcus yananensis TaxID=2879464 RepID=UPI001CF7EF50|nr:hypothetical protein [Rhodococcus yananensis]
MTDDGRRIGYAATAVAAAIPLLLAGAGAAGAMGGNDPAWAHFVSDSNSITAHVDQSQGMTDCRVAAQGAASSDIHETDWTSDEWITVWVPPGRYTATLLCRSDMSGPDGWIVRQEPVNAPPTYPEGVIDFIETNTN